MLMIKNITIIAFITFFVMCVTIILANNVEEYSYSYDSTTGVYTEIIDGTTYTYEEFTTTRTPVQLKATSVSIGSNGWTVICDGLGNDCEAVLNELYEKWQELY